MKTHVYKYRLDTDRRKKDNQLRQYAIQLILFTYHIDNIEPETGHLMLRYYIWLNIYKD